MINLFQNKGLSFQRYNSIKTELWAKVLKNLLCTIRCYDSKKNIINGYSLLKAVDAELKSFNYSLEFLFKAEHKDFDSICSTLSGFDTFSNIYQKPNGKKRHRRYRIDTFFTKMYEKFRLEYGAEYIKSLGMVVCPYCNRNYIDSGNEDTIAELDHFLDKKQYPWLSITLENLVPCCSACNHLKRQNAISYSPYDALRKTDAIIEFVFYPKKINEFGVFALPLENPSGHFPMKNNIDVFKINARYEINSEEIKELVIKYQSYSKNYLDYLGRIMKGFTTELSAEEIYYGSPLSEDKYHTRPLSKFRRDILEQLKAAYKLK